MLGRCGLLHSSGEGSLPAGESRMSGAIGAPVSMVWHGGWLGSRILNVEGQRGKGCLDLAASLES